MGLSVAQERAEGNYADSRRQKIKRGGNGTAERACAESKLLCYEAGRAPRQAELRVIWRLCNSCGQRSPLYCSPRIHSHVLSSHSGVGSGSALSVPPCRRTALGLSRHAPTEA